jgi:hypothetical protein
MRELSSAASRRMALTLKRDMFGAMVAVVCAQWGGSGMFSLCILCVERLSVGCCGYSK